MLLRPTPCRAAALLTVHRHHPQTTTRPQALADLRRELSDASLQNEQLKLEVLRWRKQASLLRLKLASTKESVTLQEQNAQLLSEREQRMHAELAALAEQLQQANAHVMRVTAAKAQAQAECAKYQARGGGAWGALHAPAAAQCSSQCPATPLHAGCFTLLLLLPPPRCLLHLLARRAPRCRPTWR